MLRAPGNTKRYLDAYFVHVHAWLPFVDKFKISSFAQHTLSDRDWVRLSSQESANLALIWAIIAYTTSQVSDIEETFLEAETISSRTAYSSARSLLPADEADFKTEHTQALILLSLSQFWDGCWKSSWALIGLAGRLAIRTTDPSDMSTQHHLSSNERRTILASFVVEGLIASYLGRETQHATLSSLVQKLPQGQTDVSWEIEEDGWEEWSNWTERNTPTENDSYLKISHGPSRILSTHNQLVRLVEIMNGINSAIHASHASQLYTALSKRLSDWYSNIEKSLPFLGMTESETPLLHIAHLHLIYWTQRCMIYNYDSLTEENGNCAREGTEGSQYLASKVNQILRLYKTSNKLATSPLSILNAVTASIPLVESSSALGVQLRSYLEEIQSTRAPMNAFNTSEGLVSMMIPSNGKPVRNLEYTEIIYLYFCQPNCYIYRQILHANASNSRH